jgi:AraC-like DNA-binding protein
VSKAISVYHGRFGRATLYRLNRPMTTHAHREGHVIFHLEGPHSRIEVSGKLHTQVPGRATLVNPWELHDFQPTDLGAGALYLVLYINPNWFAVGRSASTLRFGQPEIDVTERIAWLRQRVVELLLGARPVAYFDGYLYDLTSACFEESWRYSSAPRVIVPQQAEAVSDFRVRKSIQLITERLGDGIQLDAVAREAGLSRPHFYKLFRKLTGITPNIYLNTLLMERAIETLAATERSVTEIGFDLGFSSQSSFTRFFAANVGMAPTDYRKVVQVVRG